MRAMVGVALDLALKYAATALVMAVVLSVAGHQPLGSVLYSAVWVTVVAYLLGDLVVYRYFGNVWAVLTDFLVATLTIWVLSQMVMPRIPVGQAVVAGAAVAAVEFLYHTYLGRRGYRRRIGD